MGGTAPICPFCKKLLNLGGLKDHIKAKHIERYEQWKKDGFPAYWRYDNDGNLINQVKEYNMYYLYYTLGNPQGDNPEDEDTFMYKAGNIERLLHHLKMLGNQQVDWQISNSPINGLDSDYINL